MPGIDTKAHRIVTEALGLSPQARAFVAEKLIESLDATSAAGLSPAWRDEIRRRSREVDEGLVDLHDAADAFARAYGAVE